MYKYFRKATLRNACLNKTVGKQHCATHPRKQYANQWESDTYESNPQIIWRKATPWNASTKTTYKSYREARLRNVPRRQHSNHIGKPHCEKRPRKQYTNHIRKPQCGTHTRKYFCRSPSRSDRTNRKPQCDTHHRIIKESNNSKNIYVNNIQII